jgi:hypothetical protein
MPKNSKICKEWRENPTENPRTGRAILPHKKTYQKLEEECGFSSPRHTRSLSPYRQRSNLSTPPRHAFPFTRRPSIVGPARSWAARSTLYDYDEDEMQAIFDTDYGAEVPDTVPIAIGKGGKRVKVGYQTRADVPGIHAFAKRPAHGLDKVAGSSPTLMQIHARSAAARPNALRRNVPFPRNIRASPGVDIGTDTATPLKIAMESKKRLEEVLLLLKAQPWRVDEIANTEAQILHLDNEIDQYALLNPNGPLPDLVKFPRGNIDNDTLVKVLTEALANGHLTQQQRQNVFTATAAAAAAAAQQTQQQHQAATAAAAAAQQTQQQQQAAAAGASTSGSQTNTGGVVTGGCYRRW